MMTYPLHLIMSLYKHLHIWFQPFLERKGDWTYCALAIRHLSTEDAGNYTVTVKNKFGEKSNHVRLSMKDQNQPTKYSFFSSFLFFLCCRALLWGFEWKKAVFWDNVSVPIDIRAVLSRPFSGSRLPVKKATSSTWSARLKPCQNQTSGQTLLCTNIWC